MAIPVALQMYTVRDVLSDRFERTLKDLGKFGYKYFELAGFHGRRPDRIRDFCRKHNMRPISAHVPFEKLRSGIDEVSRDMRMLGVRHVVCPMLPELYRDEDGMVEAADIFMEIARRLSLDGFTFSYHNHAFELEDQPGGKTLMEILLARTEPRLVNWQIDVCWVERAGKDSVQMMKDYKDRISMVHVKDMLDDEKKRFTELGNGAMPLPKILRAARAANVEALIIEQDNNWSVSPMSSAKQSFEYMEPLVKQLG